MESQDQRAAVRKLTGILRKITRVIQWIPFVYLAVYSLTLLCEHFIPETLLCIQDSVLVTTPTTTVGFLFMSRLLELCRWHKIACLLPMSSQVTNYIDSFMFQFTSVEIVILNLVIGLISLTFLIQAYHHFFGHGRKRNHPANA